MKKILEPIKVFGTIIVVIILFILELTIGENKVGITTVNLTIILPISLIFYILSSYKLFIEAFNSIRHKDFFTEVTLTLIATLAAFAIQEFVEALAILAFFNLGELFEKHAINKSRESIKETISIKPKIVHKLEGEKEINISPYKALVGDTILVKVGETIPLDGIILKGDSSLDTSSLTGESVPIYASINNEVKAGYIVLNSPLTIKTTKKYKDTSLYKILDIVENATDYKSKPEKFITKFARYYTPIVLILAVLVATIAPLIVNMSDGATWIKYLRIAISFLVMSCPCALVISVPLAYFVSLGKASKEKLLIKGSSYLDVFRKIDTVYLDKTGTLTKGNFVATNIDFKGVSKEEFLSIVKTGESRSNHPIAKAIMNIEGGSIFEENSIQDYQEIAGKGILFTIKNNTYAIGNAKLLSEFCRDFNEIQSVFTVVYAAKNNEYLGSITIKDEIKESSVNAIKNMKKLGIKNIVMLTGDNKKIANEISNEVGLSSYKANLLPEEKLEVVKLESANKNTMFIGDGINDSPSLISAKIGVAMGIGGSDIAIESADAIVMNDDINTVNKGIKIAKRNALTVKVNIVFALASKLAVMILSLIPTLNIDSYLMYLAIFADVGVSILCILNALLLKYQNTNLNK